MTSPPANFTKFRFATAGEVAPLLTLTPQAAVLFAEDLPAPTLFQRLAEAELLSDAVAVLAHALMKREAVWWACLAARSALDEMTSPGMLASLDAAEEWVYRPTEENRRRAMEAATKSGFDHAAAWAATAAFWSGGSMVGADLPVVPPGDQLCGKAVAGAVMLAAVTREPEKAKDKLRLFLAQAIDIARGGSGRNKAENVA